MNLRKKISALLILISAGFGTVSAQENYPVSNFLGVHAGYNMSRINTTLNLGMKFTNGADFGIVFQNYNHKNFGSQIEINFTERGGTNRFDKEYLTDTVGLPDTIGFKLKLQYIELAWMTDLQIGKNKNKLNIILGPNVSYLLNQKLTFTYTELISGYPENVQRNFDLGVNIGASYARILQSGKIDFELRYTHGFFSLYESRTINNSIVNQNQVLTFKIAYLFKLGK
jgi:hypothetical protein